MNPQDPALLKRLLQAAASGHHGAAEAARRWEEWRRIPLNQGTARLRRHHRRAFIRAAERAMEQLGEADGHTERRGPSD